MEEKTFVEIIFAGLSLSEFFAYWTIAMFGVIMMLGLDILQRKPESKESPKPFDLGYWWKDNKIRIIITLLLIPVALMIRNIAGGGLNWESAFYVGFSGDLISIIIKKKANLGKK